VLKSLPFVLGIAAMTLLLLWLVGAFQDKIPMAGPREQRKLAANEALHEVQRRSYPELESAVGTVRPIAETNVGSKILARVQSMRIERAGQAVKKGEVLVLLDDSDLIAGLEQARQPSAPRRRRRTRPKSTSSAARSSSIRT
jgi:multidrug efflux pump subunit AcrA (membrane-fusion protein)